MNVKLIFVFLISSFDYIPHTSDYLIGEFLWQDRKNNLSIKLCFFKAFFLTKTYNYYLNYLNYELNLYFKQNIKKEDIWIM